MANKKGKRKTDWFEALCMMGSGEASEKNNKKKKTAGRKKGNSGGTVRTRVENRSSDPYGFDDADIPPFDPTEDAPVADELFNAPEEDAAVSSGQTVHKRVRSSSAGGTSASARASSTGCDPRKTTRQRSTPKKQKDIDAADVPKKPAELIYFLQPYVVFVLGAVLAVEMLLSFVLSGGAFDWTPDTQPFRLIGYYLEYFLFGLFGYGAYLLPAAMMYLSFDKLRRGKLYRPAGKGLLALGILLLLPAVIHVCQVNAGVDTVPDAAGIKLLYAAGAARAGAGVLGGLLAYLANIGLGVIGTLIVGVVMLVPMTLLLLGFTPASAWKKLRDSIRAAVERRAEYREQREQSRLAAQTELPMLASSAAEGEKKKKSRESVADEDTPDPKQEMRAAREKEKRQQQALREAERSDRKEAGASRRRAASYGADGAVGDAEEEFDPAAELLHMEMAAQPKVAVHQSEPPVEADTPDERRAAEVFGVVRELPVQDAVEEEECFLPSDTVAVLPVMPDDGGASEDESGAPQIYPMQAEIDLDMDEEVPQGNAPGADDTSYDPTIAPGEAPLEDLLATTDDADGAEIDELEGEGGVTIRVQKLSEEEKMRGERMATKGEEEKPRPRPYQFPRIDLLDLAPAASESADIVLQRKAMRLRDTLSSFNVRVEGVTYVGGPTVTRYEVKPAPGVRVRSIAALADDIAMGLEASGAIRIEAPIPGKNAVGIEVPNEDRSTVYLRGLIDSETFRGGKSRLTCCLGEAVGGLSVYLDISKMPHLLIAGSTGTGKSVCINSLVMSLLYKAKPDEVKLIMVDPKTVEFSVYKDIPHLLAPIVCDPKRAAAALNLAVQEMERRYEKMRAVGVRNIEGYNEITANDRYEHPYIPQIVIIIDELADLMMTAKNEVEASIVRLAQKARAAGIHLILGTQRPSVDVITGLIKANVPSRIAFTVTSQVDSRTILDNAGAEKLVGRGDMLYAPIGSSKPLRVQGCFVSDGEVERIVEFIRRNNDPVKYDEEFLANLDREAELIGNKKGERDDDDDGERAPGDLDPKFYEALGVAVKNKRISTSLLQRAISIGYGRAAKILDQMEEKGFISPASGNKPREILISEEAYRELMINREE